MKTFSETIKLPYKTAFVVNPAAGGGLAGRVWPVLSAWLDYSGQPYLAYFTRYQGEGITLASHAVSDGAELVVAVGGDGTLREVVNGIDIGKTIFGIIPLGTGNGFRRSCGIPGQWEQALMGLSRWSPRKIDLGIVNNSFFLNVVGIGFDAAVAEIASEKYGNIKGYLAYIAAFLEELKEFDHFSVTIEGVDLSFREEKTLLAVVANGRNYGGRFSIAPQASIDDGSLDLLLVRKGNSPETTILAVRALAGRHLGDSAVVTTSGNKFNINTDHDVPVHIDGEVIGSLPVQISVMPAALQILAPPSEDL
ncbi:MAG: diacylglycerol/lipid kinase family protein [Dethiobacteria bacterium]